MKIILLLACLAVPFVSDVTQPVSWGAVSESAWQGLLDRGWQGDPTDHAEVLHPPGSF